jgi:hypothetical protein
MRCDACAWSYEDLEVAEVPTTLRALAADYPELKPTRTSPEVWSPLEYGCHVRDVLLVQRDRLVRAVVEDVPSMPSMARDERVTLLRYADSDPDEVRGQVVVAADLLAWAWDGLTQDQLTRAMHYGYPEPAVRDIAWLGRHSVHELRHHLDDILRQG